MSISLFDRAYGRPASRESSWSCHEAAPWESTWPCAPAGAPQRPAGAIGPVAPTTLGMAEQASCMMLASGTFGHEAAARDKLRFGGQLRSKPEPLPVRTPCMHVCAGTCMHMCMYWDMQCMQAPHAYSIDGIYGVPNACMNACARINMHVALS
eukprot:366222-Chlamydomonas_euryale.AAC.9